MWDYFGIITVSLWSASFSDALLDRIHAKKVHILYLSVEISEPRYTSAARRAAHS